MLTTLRKAAYKYGYLLIVAAWLYTISFIASNYLSYTATTEKAQKKIQQKLDKHHVQVSALLADTSRLTKLLTHQLTETSEIEQKGFGFFLYTATDKSNPQQLYWNSNHFYISHEDLQKADGSYWIHNANGDFELIKQSVQLNQQQYFAIAMLPIRWEYFINNKYLHTGFDGLYKLNNGYEIVNANGSFGIKGLYQQTLFSIQKKAATTVSNYDAVTILLRCIAMLLLLLFLHRVAVYILDKKNFTSSFVFLLTAIVVLRIITYYLPFPFNYKQLPLFDPSIYASNFLHPSLGHLLINSLFLLWMVAFFKFYNTPTTWPVKWVKPVSYLYLITLTISTLLIAGVARSLVQDSKISFDVSNLFSLNIYSFISFVILCILALCLFHLSHILLKSIKAAKLAPYQQSLIVAIAGLLVLSIWGNLYAMGSNLCVLGWLIVYLFIMHFRMLDAEQSMLKSSIFIFWVMFFALSTAALVLFQNRQIEIEQRKKFAENLALQADPASESLLSIATTNFNDKFLTQNFTRLQSEFSNKVIKDSLINENFSGYLNKYDTRIYSYDSLFHPLFNDDSTSYASIRTILLNQGKATSIADLYSYSTANQKSSYLYEKKIISPSTNIMGYLFVLVKPKRYKSEALYPELFRQTQDLNADFITNYAYAIYSKGKLITHYNDYSFPATLVNQNLPLGTVEQRSNDGYNELWYNANNGKRIIVVKKNAWSLEFITLFAYLFGIFVIVISLFHFARFIVKTGFKKQGLTSLFQLNIRLQIHSTIIFISVFSFIIIGIATISFFIYRFNQSNEERLSKSIRVMANEIEERVKVVRSQLSFDDVLTINDVGFGSDLEKKINEVSEVHNVEVNLYNTSGTLKASTQPYIYNKHLLSDKMDPIAYHELVINKKVHFIHSEKIAGLDFLSIYIPVNDEEGHTYAYLNIPYLNSQAELNQEISGFLATLINLNAFIFLLAGAIAFIITNRITSSFSLITEKMKRINLGKVNEEIEWHKQDEIGVLVQEYNKMVNKLEASAKALAQSEREGAWKEMARQVAHEIKNPLTPMKLSIQYLQKAMDTNAPNVQEMGKQVAETLVQQIDQLANIASDFSQFANISNPKPERFDLTETITTLVQLHATNNQVQISYQLKPGSYFVWADKMQLSRLFTNLLKNAIESVTNQQTIQISIVQESMANMAQISITDNGQGIPADMQHKIFMPNFTTKTSGTGLGLAICKGIVENAQGKIWFETTEEKGTTFYVQIPVVE